MRMNKAMPDLIKKELKRLEKAYERAKENTKNCTEASSKLFELHKELHRLTGDKSIAPKDLLKRLEEMKVQRENLIKLMNQDYCKLVDKEVKLLMQLQEMQRNINAIEFEERAISAWNKKRSMMRADEA